MHPCVEQCAQHIGRQDSASGQQEALIYLSLAYLSIGRGRGAALALHATHIPSALIATHYLTIRATIRISPVCRVRVGSSLRCNCREMQFDSAETDKAALLAMLLAVVYGVCSSLSARRHPLGSDGGAVGVDIAKSMVDRHALLPWISPSVRIHTCHTAD
jgi:hypothetical protein